MQWEILKPILPSFGCHQPGKMRRQSSSAIHRITCRRGNRIKDYNINKVVPNVVECCQPRLNQSEKEVINPPVTMWPIFRIFSKLQGRAVAILKIQGTYCFNMIWMCIRQKIFQIIIPVYATQGAQLRGHHLRSNVNICRWGSITPGKGCPTGNFS